MASLPNSKTVTYEEWLHMPQVDDAIEEVVNGEIRIMPPAKRKHARIVAKLNTILVSQLDPDRVEVYTGSFGLIIRKFPLSTRSPDLAVFESSTILEKDGYFHSAPQLLVEVLSPANTPRERADKLNDYTEMGVPEVWVISHEARTVEVLQLEHGQLRRIQIAATGALTPKLFPHVSVEIERIWPD
jgi:Uma2 family endonuclease